MIIKSLLIGFSDSSRLGAISFRDERKNFIEILAFARPSARLDDIEATGAAAEVFWNRQANLFVDGIWIIFKRKKADINMVGVQKPHCKL